MARSYSEDGRQAYGAHCGGEAVPQPTGGRPTDGRPGVHVLGRTCGEGEGREEMATGGEKDKGYDMHRAR